MNCSFVTIDHLTSLQPSKSLGRNWLNSLSRVLGKDTPRLLLAKNLCPTGCRLKTGQLELEVLGKKHQPWMSSEVWTEEVSSGITRNKRLRRSTFPHFGTRPTMAPPNIVLECVEYPTVELAEEAKKGFLDPYDGRYALFDSPFRMTVVDTSSIYVDPAAIALTGGDTCISLVPFLVELSSALFLCSDVGCVVTARESATMEAIDCGSDVQLRMSRLQWLSQMCGRLRNLGHEYETSILSRSTVHTRQPRG
ncbi:hypothetical protein L227DRAFT_345200 [Lentinus tigrinus ALCF2SS1-6]|uniref:Uncharacterized protein n=1 Tax=Lentinus tigrinus ALCF2SS1-6 TaxID=1328759 RepID=A0A5C2RV65_9APHY|nr:hypothetical protein L227DRAFT_345200 [Lentinus tigrinus ALCF2SS1-6]